MTKVINLFGGPNTGKSTTAAGLFYVMRLEQYDCELVTEYPKELVLNKQFDILSQQALVTQEQFRRQFIFDGKTDYIITDSPTVLGAYYMRNGSRSLKKFLIDQFNESDNLNFFLENDGDIPFKTNGRHLSSEESKIASRDIRSMLDDNNIPYHTIKTILSEGNVYESHISQMLRIIKETQ